MTGIFPAGCPSRVQGAVGRGYPPGTRRESWTRLCITLDRGGTEPPSLSRALECSIPAPPAPSAVGSQLPTLGFGVPGPPALLPCLTLHPGAPTGPGTLGRGTRCDNGWGHSQHHGVFPSPRNLFFPHPSQDSCATIQGSSGTGQRDEL